MGDARIVEKTRASGSLTEAGFRGKIKSALRKASRFWKPITECKHEARTSRQTNPKTGRLCWFSLCSKCNEEWPESQTQVDHISPVVDPFVGFQGWDEYIERLFCEKENFQVLCKPCHEKKTNEEKALAKERNKKNV